MTSSLVLLPASARASFLLSPHWPCPPPMPACNWEAAAVQASSGQGQGRFGEGGGEGRKERK